MKHNIYLFLLFFSASLFAQNDTVKTKPYILLRVHPVAYVANAYNIGIEVRATPTVHFTLSAFRQAYLNEPLSDLFGNIESETKNINGATGRLGFKYMTEGDTKKHRNYVELQVRYGKVSQEIHFKDNDKNPAVQYQSQLRRQVAILFGFQHRVSNRFFIDFYGGLGLLVLNTQTEEKRFDPTLNRPIYHDFDRGGTVYIGTSLCFDTRRKSKIKNM